MIFAALLLLVSAGADALVIGNAGPGDYLPDMMPDNTHAGITEYWGAAAQEGNMWGAMKGLVEAAVKNHNTEGASFFENWNQELPDQQDPANKMLNDQLSNIAYFDGEYDRENAKAEVGEELTWHDNPKYQPKLPNIKGNKGNTQLDQKDRSTLNGRPSSYWWPSSLAMPLDPEANMGRRNPDSRSGLPPALQIPARASSMGMLTKTGDNSGTRGMLPLDLELAAEANSKAGSGVTMAQAYRDAQKAYVARLHGGANGLENGKPVYRTPANVYADQAVDGMLNRLRRTVDDQKKELGSAVEG